SHRSEAAQRIERLWTFAWLRNNGIPILGLHAGLMMMTGALTVAPAEFLGIAAEAGGSRLLLDRGLSRGARELLGSAARSATTVGTLPLFRMGLESLQQGNVRNWTGRDYLHHAGADALTLGLFRTVNGAMTAMNAPAAIRHAGNI